MNKKVVALDVDGVLMECYPPINKKIIDTFNVSDDFKIQRIVRSWNMHELPEDIRLFALDCMGDADIVRQYTFKKGSKKFVKELYEMLVAVDGELIFNTHCFNQAVGDVRREQLETLSEQLGITPKYYISIGPKKINAESTVIIDDCFGNLQSSNAETKVLFSMFHNRNLNEGDAFRSRNYNDIIQHVKEAILV